MRTNIENMVVGSGLWNGEGRETHSFLVTPDVYPLSQTQHASLVKLGPALETCFVGLGKLATIAADSRLSQGPAWQTFRDVTKMEVSHLHRRLQILRPSKAPTICKVDLVEDEDGHLRLIEIDAMNRRGMGYTTLFNQVRDEITAPNSTRLPGVVQMIVTEMKNKRWKKNSTLVFLYAHRERFYLHEFFILQRALAARGVTLLVASEFDIDVQGDNLLVHDEVVQRPLLTNLPEFTGGDSLPADRAMEDLSLIHI